MPNYSYVQSDFRGGLWSESAQGRMELPIYKTALNECLNSLPQEDGSWTRRPGFRYIVHPKGGQNGRLVPFRFSRSEAYQAELTPLCLRFVVGLTLLKVEPTTYRVVNISSAAVAVVKLTNVTILANGDTIMFDMASDPPSSYTLYGRQFIVRNLNATKKTFTLEDPITGLAIAGSEIAWRNLGGGVDNVKKVLEYVTPYTAADLPFIRITQDSKDTVLFFCPGRPTYALIVNGATQFTFAPADFQDGPYLDENELVTTLTLSALTGSVTVTASSTAGINEGQGFLTTDVGRLIWFQGGPAAWSNAVPYAKDAKVLGSDGNIYKSMISNNLANDPLTDTGTKWEITAEVVAVTWLKITARASTTSVTALVRGTATTSGVATIHWRLGVFSDTTGYPTCGAYHEGRLVLAGAIKNRFDMSKNFKGLTFSPTELDGTVSDDNSVAGTLNNKDAELISAMLSVDEGLFIGTLSGEWLLKASALDDPVSPTSVQARNPATAGVANIEVLHIYGMPTYVQARQRKMQTHRRVEGKFESINHNKFAQGLTSPRIVETAWCQEPMISFFCRMSDGKLTGAIHKVSQLDESYTGWHRHTHAMSRKFEALSSGPNFSGTSDSVFVITAHPSNPTAPRWIETMMPTQSEGDPSWVAWHTDGSGTGHYIRRMISANGDAYDGLKIYGLWHLNGEVVHPYIGGLDLGNFTVALGSIDLPYSGTFTAAFLANLNDGTDYSDWGVQLNWADAPITTNPLRPLNSILVIDNEITATPSGSYGLWDRDREEFYRYTNVSIRVFDALDGDLLREAANYNAVFPSGGAEGFLTVYTNIYLVPPDPEHPAGSSTMTINFAAAGDSVYTLGLVDNQTLVKWGQIKADEDPGTDTFPPNNLFALPLLYPDPLLLTAINSNFVVSSLAGSNGRVRIYGASSSGPIGVLYGVGGIMFNSTNTGGDNYKTMFFRMYEMLGVTVFGSIAPNGNTSATSFAGAFQAVYNEWTVGGLSPDLNLGIGVVADNKFNITAVSIDAAWVTGFGECTMTYIAYDDTFLLSCTGLIPTSRRMIKLSREGAIIWNMAMPVGIGSPPGQGDGPWNNHRWGWLASDGVVYELNLDTGAVTTFTGQDTGFNFLVESVMYYDEVGPSILDFGNFTSIGAGAVPPPNRIGTWANTYLSWTSPNWFRLWLGTSYTQDQFQRSISAEYYFNPTNFGVSFTSRGQLLRPDYGQDGGAAFGPAFGKKRRNHQWAAAFSRSFNVKIGTDFSKLYPVKFKTDGGTPLVSPSLFSGVVSDTLEDNYTYEGKLAWEVTRQYPCTITAIGGYISTQDK